MNGDEAKPVTVSIMDKEYIVACREDERESLFATVEFLNKRMRELRDSGKVIGSERVAVMAALNIAHEFLQYKRRKDDYTLQVDSGIRRMREKIAGALNRGGRLEI